MTSVAVFILFTAVGVNVHVLPLNPKEGEIMVLNVTFNNISAIFIAVNFICRGNLGSIIISWG